MNYQKFTEVRKVAEYEPDLFFVTVDMDEVVIATRETFQNVDCFRFFLRCGYTLYVKANETAIEICKNHCTHSFRHSPDK